MGHRDVDRQIRRRGGLGKVAGVPLGLRRQEQDRAADRWRDPDRIGEPPGTLVLWDEVSGTKKTLLDIGAIDGSALNLIDLNGAAGATA
jgi:hypothetical protein